MTAKQIKELLKAHCKIENGKWIFKAVDINAASVELEKAIENKFCKCKDVTHKIEMTTTKCIVCQKLINE